MGGEMTVRSEPGRGTTFVVRLFLPHVAADSLPVQARRQAWGGYKGRRRSVLVVDNEEVDRGMVASLLQPLGFRLLQAASGDAALQLLAEGAKPDAILMDLAMPGIDGWETIRRIRALQLAPGVPIAVVSANAFDKGLDNDAGITSADFIVKPVRLHELLAWLGERLHLRWVPLAAAAAGSAPHALPTRRLPGAAGEPPPAPLPAHALAALDEPIQLGHYRGVLQALDTLQAAQPQAEAFVQRLRVLAGEFQFDTMARLIGEVRDGRP
jgi:CheY-like chemotaxis protein